MQPSVLAPDLVPLLHQGWSFLQPCRFGVSFPAQADGAYHVGYSLWAAAWSVGLHLLLRLGAHEYAYECDDPLGGD